MSQRELLRQLEIVNRRNRKESFLRTLTLLWFLLAMFLGALLYLEKGYAISLHSPWTVVAILALVVTVVVWKSISLKQYHEMSIAKVIEEHFPGLKTELITAVEQKPNSLSGKYSYLQKRVIDNALWHSTVNDWRQIVPRKRLALLGLGQLGLLSLATILFASWVNHEPLAASVEPFEQSTHTVKRIPLGTVLEVEPGDVSLERGRDLLVLAKFHGQIPHEVTLEYTTMNAPSRTIVLDKQLDDPIFGGRLNDVEVSGIYHIEYDGTFSKKFRVSVFDYPDLEQADATIAYPVFVNLPETKLEDVRQLSIVEGSSVLLDCRLNKPVSKVVLVTENGLAIKPLEANRPSHRPGIRYQYRLQPKKTTVYKLHLTDHAGRKNRQPIEIVCEVTPNRKPVIKWTFPTHDIKASPLEEVSLNALVWDDFGLLNYGLKFGIAGKPMQTLNLCKNRLHTKEATLSHLISLESLSAKPDQLISYYFFADDFASDGKIRRTFSDMFFAEVRHFEEIFRQGRQQSQGGSPKKKSTVKLLQLQKQIINATWKLIRQDERNEKFLQDVSLVKDSQRGSIELLNKKKRNLKTRQLKHFAQIAEQAMQQAVVDLEKVHNEFSDPLQTALNHEKAAYQALLKLQAREHRLVKGRQSSSQGGSGGNRSQRQLQQLELANKKKRYQTNENRQDNRHRNQREDLKTLKRLKELAQRQGDLNRKLKELERALRKAKTNAEKVEKRRQLKRLREEQQKLLRDLDKLKNRIDKNQQQNMEQTRQKLERTRDQIRRSSEALKKQQISKAISSGSKAERNLKQLHREFRQRSSVRLAEDMKNLKRQAKDLADKQTKIDRKLNEKKTKEQRPSLKDAVDFRNLAKDLRNQKNDVNKILDGMKKIVQDSEKSEPLLSNRLYESIRKNRKDRPQEKLEKAAKSLERDEKKQARLSQNDAKRGIDKLRKQIDKAAESILGNELESLKQAKNTLDQLAEDLKKELQRSEAKRLPTAKSHSKNSTNKEAKGHAKSNSSKNRNGSSRNGKSVNSRQKSSFLSRGGDSGVPAGPIAGRDFQNWSQRMRDVENMLDQKQLQSKVANIRERARKVRIESKRHSKEPNWSLVRKDIIKPLVEIQRILAEEIARHQSKEALVPLDRDPVPPKYTETVKRYYEELGKGN